MIRFLTSSLILAQFLDGILTYHGILRFGIEAEANPLIVWMINLLGLGFALFLAKLIGVVLCFVIHKFYHLSEKSKAVLFSIILINLFYWGRAVIPWSVALFS